VHMYYAVPRVTWCWVWYSREREGHLAGLAKS